MKILLDGRMYGLENSGIGRYLVNLVEELKKQAKEEQFTILLRKNYFDDLNFPENWSKVLADFGHYTLSEQLFLPSLINRVGPDLVHFPHFNVPLMSSKPYVVTIHDMTMHKQGINATKLPLPIYLFKRIPYKIVFNHAVKNSVKVLVPSLSVRKDLISHFQIPENKVVVTYEGLSPSFLKKMGDRGELEILSHFSLKQHGYVFYVGNAFPHKNLLKVIEAIKVINEGRNDKIKFVVAGNQDYFTKRLENQAYNLGVQDDVKFLGYVSDDDLRVLYKNSLAFIYPSLSEGFGLQGLEAIASGSILLASDIPVLKEIYQDNAGYFNPTDPVSISHSIENAYRLARDERERLIRKAQEFIKRYSWSKMAKETIEVYKKAFGG